jgi:hypothetical protein
MKPLLFVGCLFMLLVSPGRANADSSLDGQTITTTYFFPDTGTVFAGPDTTVVPGGILNFASFANITFSANNILITTDRDAQVNNVAFDGFSFFDSNGIFASVALDASSTYAGIDASRITFTANQILVNVANLPGLDGQTISLDINSGSVPTPEPSSLIFLGTGLLGLVGFSLKRTMA